MRRLQTFDGYQFHRRTRVRCLAYADDLCLINRSTSGIQDMVDAVHDHHFTWASLTLNRCATLRIVNSRGWRVVDTFSPRVSFTEEIPALHWEETYRYLGVDLGIDLGRESRQSLENMAGSMLHDTETICIYIPPGVMAEGGCPQDYHHTPHPLPAGYLPGPSQMGQQVRYRLAANPQTCPQPTCTHLFLCRMQAWRSGAIYRRSKTRPTALEWFGRQSA